ncbi:hypothetical protein GTQ43_38115 [Nostoc sp. KVJ3]|uniref:sulfotransferase n=1 Tax=Nostoc sp. KVJ3 TaxID=457945 RepID=UPI00223839F7|nr:sulfotransferase [Nostoc sp. KVJ3]MCW5319206.1 hypothetical protein [Nostoc sp. KVJ3]
MMNLQDSIKKEFITALRHPLSYSSFLNLFRVLTMYGGIDKKYIVRALFIIFISFTGIPFRIIEKIKYGRKIEQTQIHPSPIFIIGHWRSGTTYLHNLVAQDPNLGYVSNLLAYAPESFFISQPFKKIIKKIVPSKRPMDNVDNSLTSPEEEEWAVANICPYSTYHASYFPKTFQKKFHNISELESNKYEEFINKWKNAYINF